VGHKVFAWRTGKQWLLARAFWQGYSKRTVEQLVPTETRRTEGRFLRQLLTRSVPRRVAQLVRQPKWSRVTQLVSIAVLTATVGVGYGYGIIRRVT